MMRVALPLVGPIPRQGMQGTHAVGEKACGFVKDTMTGTLSRTR